MAPIEEAIRNLYEARAKHERQIQRIDQALKALGQSIEFDGFDDLLPARPTSARDMALAVLADRPEALFDVGTIYSGAVSRGWRPASDNPRNALASALAKLAAAGEIERVGHGQYRHAPASAELLSA